MDVFLKDVKHSGRMLLRTPSFTIAATAALTLGIATNTAIYTVKREFNKAEPLFREALRLFESQVGHHTRT